MGSQLDRTWAEAVCSVCDPVCASADVGFVNQILEEPGRGVTALLWEADPHRFAERYPNSGVIESYGHDQWPPPCIDYWVYVNPEARQARISVEALSDDETVDLTGDGLGDGQDIGDVLARILRVPAPLR